MGARVPGAKQDVTPAPNAYDPATQDGAPSFTLSSRQNPPKPDAVPGPGAYDTEKYGVTGDAPAASLASRTASEKPSTTPAPNAYNPDNTVTH